MVSIEEKAKEYAGSNYTKNHNPRIWDERYSAYISGAHSRDEEVKALKELLERAKIILQQQINNTPTSEYRNLLCDFNIELHNALK